MKVDDARELLRSEYLELPGLSLTSAQVARLLDLDPPTADDTVSGLVTCGFLTCRSDGRYVRVLDEIPAAPHERPLATFRMPASNEPTAMLDR
jgi:hypothetical protein